MTVGELKTVLFEVMDDDLPVIYLPPNTSITGAFDIKGAVLVEKVTEKSKPLKGVYLLEG